MEEKLRKSQPENSYYFPSDPGFDWGLLETRAYEAWGIHKTNKAVTVAVLDSGCDARHLDLVNNIVSTFDVTGTIGAGVDLLGHGTHVCGIISGEANNDEGSVGVSYNAGLLPVNIMKRDASGDWYASSSSRSRAYAYVIRLADTYNIRVMNRSFGATLPPGSGTKETCEYEQSRAIAAAGILPVTASGNEYETYSSGYDHSPSSYEFGLNVINVEESGLEVRRASSSNCNYDSSPYPNIDHDSEHACTISAPGTHIYSTIIDTDPNYVGTSGGDGIANDYGYKTGTSMATPYVSGIAALVFSANPKLSVKEVKEIIEKTANDIVYPADDQHNEAGPGYDLETGYGCIDARAAVEKAFSRLPKNGDVSGFLKVEFQQDRFKDFTYSTQPILPEIKVKLGERELKPDVDYKLSYHNNIDVGNYAYVQITGIGDFEGTDQKAYFTINPIPLSAVDMHADDIEYAGVETAMPSVSCSLPISLETLNNNIEKTCSRADDTGNATVTIKAKANSIFSGEKTLSFKVLPLDFANISSISLFSNNFYTGKRITPLSGQCTVNLFKPMLLSAESKKSLDKLTLKEGVDYKATYANNVNAGKASYTVTGIGSCKGMLTGSKFSFAIQKAANTMTMKVAKKKHNVSVKTLKKKNVTISPKYTIKNPRGSVTFKKTKGSNHLTVDSKGRIKVKKGTSKGTYKAVISVTAKGNNNYKPKTVKYTATIKVK